MHTFKVQNLYKTATVIYPELNSLHDKDFFMNLKFKKNKEKRHKINSFNERHEG